MSFVNEHFFVAISFGVFLVAVIPVIRQKIIGGLAKTQKNVKSQLDNAINLKQDAISNYNNIKLDQQNVEEYCNKIIANAKKEAENIIEHSRKESIEFYQKAISESQIRSRMLEKIVITEVSNDILANSLKIVKDYLEDQNIETININRLDELCKNIERKKAESTN